MYELGGTVLGCATSKKYLRVFLHHDLKWDHHIDQVSSKVARKLGFMRLNMLNLRGAPADCKKEAGIHSLGKVRNE